MILPLRKTYTHILCLGIACCTLSPAMAQKADQTLKEKYRKEITSFFDQRLKDDTITFSTAIRMKWKETDDITYDRVIDVYIKELRKKLQLDCITTIRNVGYKLERK